jgi:hypothetical protein
MYSKFLSEWFSGCIEICGILGPLHQQLETAGLSSICNKVNEKNSLYWENNKHFIILLCLILDPQSRKSENLRVEKTREGSLNQIDPILGKNGIKKTHTALLSKVHL